MRSLHLTLIAAACAAALPAFAQTAGSAGAGAAAGPGAAGAPSASTVPSTPVPSTTVPSTTVPTFPSSTTNPSFGTSNPSFGTTNPTFGAAPTTGSGGIADSSGSVSAQAQQRRQLALQQCGGMSGSAQTDCVRAADDAFARETGSATLSPGAGGAGTGAIAAGPAPGIGPVAGNLRTTPDVSPTPPDTVAR